MVTMLLAIATDMNLAEILTLANLSYALELPSRREQLFVAAGPAALCHNSTVYGSGKGSRRQ